MSTAMTCAAPRTCASLNGHHSQPTHTEHGHILAGLEPRLAQRVQRGGRRAHHDRPFVERHAVGQRDQTADRQDDLLGVSAVAVLADHLSFDTKLLGAMTTVVARATRHHVVCANAVARRETVGAVAHRFDHPGDLVPERQRQRPGRRGPRTVVRVGMADPCSLDVDSRFSTRRCRPLQRHFYQGFAGLDEAYGPHATTTRVDVFCDNMLYSRVTPSGELPHTNKGEQR